MTDSLIAAAVGLAATAVLCFTFLRAWNGWLALRRLELARGSLESEAGEAEMGVRIELAAVRERLRKLEAIASGVEL